MSINKATWKIVSLSNSIQELAWLLGDDVDYEDVLKSLQVSGLISQKLALDVVIYLFCLLGNIILLF